MMKVLLYRIALVIASYVTYQMGRQGSFPGSTYPFAALTVPHTHGRRSDVWLQPLTKHESHRDADKLVARATNKGHTTMLGGLLSRPRSGPTRLLRWRKRITIIFACLAILAGSTYVARCALLLKIARIILNRDPGLVAQEREDSVAISFADPPPAWTAPMKNQMNDIWDPIAANGVNYYMFALPRTWFTPYSERSNPLSPYYQAWVGGYVIKKRDGSLPANLEMLAWQVTALDQRSWLSAMGDPRPLADASQATRVGNILINGLSRPLWHGTMQSHSDLSADAPGPLPTLIGMPPKSSWPSGVTSYHDVILDGYFACWVDPQRKVSVVVYGVAATYPGKHSEKTGLEPLNDEILNLMKSARLQPVN